MVENIRVENPVTPEAFIQAMSELGVSFPLTCSQRDMGVLLDADGDELLTIDSSGSMPDNTVALLCANIVMVLNNAAGYRAVAALVPLEQDGSIAAAIADTKLVTLEMHLKGLVIANPEKALLAALDDDVRMWFVAELTSVAGASVPLTDIEAMVSRSLTPAKGGTA